MELWIRSQDRNRLKKIEDSFIIQETQVNPHSHWWGIMADGSYLAEYNSKERALEVLDEISEIMTNLADSDLKLIQYEMPKD